MISDIFLKSRSENLRVIQVAPVHCAVQVHVSGFEQVPPFWHGLVQIAEKLRVKS